jgi:hypothetical protein
LPEREGDIQALYTMLRSEGFRFGAVWGESGCEKTSLLRAGLRPFLRQNNLHTVYLARTTADPIAAIEDRLVQEPLHDGVSPTSDPSNTPSIVIVDQFGEFFLANPNRDQSETLRRWLGGNVANGVGRKLV